MGSGLGDNNNNNNKDGGLGDLCCGWNHVEWVTFRIPLKVELTVLLSLKPLLYGPGSERDDLLLYSNQLSPQSVIVLKRPDYQQRNSRSFKSDLAQMTQQIWEFFAQICTLKRCRIVSNKAKDIPASRTLVVSNRVRRGCPLAPAPAASGSGRG